VVVKADQSARLRIGDIVLVPSTDYRDIRKAAFQEYAVATHYNAARIPRGKPIHAASSLGVAFVASALALGISLGLDFSQIAACRGPNLVDIIRQVDEEHIPADIKDECYSGLNDVERLKPGQWIAIWGGVSTIFPYDRVALTASSFDNHWLYHVATCENGEPQGDLCG
jgi:hypothetical protein